MTAYSIVRIDVKDADEYAKYAEIATRALKEFGGEFLARGGEYPVSYTHLTLPTKA